MRDLIEDRSFALERVGPSEWAIRHVPEAAGEGESTVVAFLTEAEDGFIHVTWLITTPLPSSYATAEDAMEDLGRWARMKTGEAQHPESIPHLPPFSPAPDRAADRPRHSADDHPRSRSAPRMRRR